MKRQRITLDWEASDEPPQDLFLKSATVPPPVASLVPDVDYAEISSAGKTIAQYWAGIGQWSALLTAMVVWILSQQAAVEKHELHDQTVVQIQQAIDNQQRRSTGLGQAAQVDLIDAATPPSWQTECMREQYRMPDTEGQGMEFLSVTQVEFCGDQVVADLVNETADLHVTRAYRQEDGRWVRTMPASDC